MRVGMVVETEAEMVVGMELVDDEWWLLMAGHINHKSVQMEDMWYL